MFTTLINLRHILTRPSVFLELTPPAGTDKASIATQRLFSVLYGLDASRTLKERVLRRKVSFSLEVVSTKNEGIRFLMRVPESDAANIERAINSYMPDVRCKRVEDYLGDIAKARVVEIVQTGHFAYPLPSQDEFSEHDPMAYLSGAMTKLHQGDLMAMQVVVSPTHVSEARRIQRKLLHNEEHVYDLGRRGLPVVGPLLGLISSALFGLLDTAGEVASGGSITARSVDPHEMHRQQAAMRIKPARTLSQFEQQLAESVHDKLRQPLFEVQVRVLVNSSEKTGTSERIKGVRDWLALFEVPGYQRLRVKIDWPWLRGMRRLLFKHRLPGLIKTSIFSATEIAELYHFPHTESARVENVVRSLSRTLPAPVSFKNNPKFDVVLGRNHHHGTSTDIGMTASERERHVYIIGGTGNGKTTLMEYAILQDIRNGKGVTVIDPHGDLAERLLRFIPEERTADVVYFDPHDEDYSIGVNLLEIPEGLTGVKLLEAKDQIAEAVISVMRKIFSEDDSGGHRIEYILRNTAHTALTIPGATIFTVYDLLTDIKFRNWIVKGLKDEKLKNFWINEIGKAGDMQRVRMSAGVTTKIGRFQFSVWIRRVMEQPKSTINFDEILDGKILICNFAKGNLGEDGSSLFGVVTLAMLQLATYRRVQKKPEERKPFYLYVDEFQNFATMSFVQLLSEARKYKLFLTMAEQSTSQQEKKQMVNTILANVGTIVCFRSGSPADEQFMLPFFEPYIHTGEIRSLPSYNFYAQIAAKVPQEPVSGETLLNEAAGSEEIARRVIEASRANYAKRCTVGAEAVQEPAEDKAAAPNPKRKAAKKGAASEGTEFPGGVEPIVS